MSETTASAAPIQSRVALQFNGAALTLAADTSLEALLDQQGVVQAGVATAVNGAFVPRSLRAQHRMQTGDTVLTFQAIVGG